MALGRPLKLSAARPPKGKLKSLASMTCLPEASALMNCWKMHEFSDVPCKEFVTKLSECMAKRVSCCYTYFGSFLCRSFIPRVKAFTNLAALPTIGAGAK